MELRPDQAECVEAVRDAWTRGVQRPAVVAPTGWGKTFAFVHLCSSLVREEGRRPLILVHREELVLQTVESLRRADPWLSVGVIKGTKNQVTAEVTVGSIQTMSRQNRLDAIDPERFTDIICDEAHVYAAAGPRRILTHFGAFDPESNCRAVGFTATMHRADKLGLGEIWETVVFQRDTRWAIGMGFLVPVDALRVVVPKLDLGAVRVHHGDLGNEELAKAMAQAEAGPFIAQAYLEHCCDATGELRRGIGFAPTIELAESWTYDFRAAGIPTELVIGTTDTPERQLAYARTAAGENKVLWSVGVLSTGFDLPAVEVAIMGRPTKSRGLYVQSVGRVLRLSPSTGKTRALILDVVGVTAIGLASMIDLELDEPEKAKDELLDELDEKGLPIRIPKDLLEIPPELVWTPADAFSGEYVPRHLVPKPPKIPKPPRPANPKGWDLTETGIPFLPPVGHHDSYVFIHLKDDVYRVGERPKGRGKAKLLGQFSTFAEAVACAEDAHPGPPRALVGFATDAQLAELRRCGKAVGPMTTKDEAGKMLTKIYATRSIG